MGGTRNDIITVASTASVILAPNRPGRTAIYISNATGQILTITKGDQAAVANQGIVLQPTTVWFETDGEGFRCWRGTITAITSAGTGSVGIAETME